MGVARAVRLQKLMEWATDNGCGQRAMEWKRGNSRQDRQQTVNNQQLMGVAKATMAGKERGMQETAMVARHKYFVQY